MSRSDLNCPAINPLTFNFTIARCIERQKTLAALPKELTEDNPCALDEERHCPTGVQVMWERFWETGQL